MYRQQFCDTRNRHLRKGDLSIYLLTSSADWVGLAHSMLPSSYLEYWAPPTIWAVAPEKTGDANEIIGEVLTDDSWVKSS